MKTWEEAIALATAIRAGVVRSTDLPLPAAFSYVNAGRWLSEFVLEVQALAEKDAAAGDPVETARTLRICQRRCTELLLELRALKALRVQPATFEPSCPAWRNPVEKIE